MSRIRTGFKADPYQAIPVNADPDPDPRFWKLEEITVEKTYFFGEKLQFSFPYDSIKDVQATEAFTPQKRTFSTSKHEIS